MTTPTSRWLWAAALVVVSGAICLRGLTSPPGTDERTIERAASSLADRGWRDPDAGALPVFVRTDHDEWLPPFPVYATAALISLRGKAGGSARWSSALCGVADALAMFLLAMRLFRRPAIAFVAAVLLTVTPAHVRFSGVATIDGIWQVPFILGWAIGLTALTQPPSRRGRWMLAAGTAALAASDYTQPSATLMMPLFGIVTVEMWMSAGNWRARDAFPAAAGFLAMLAPLLIWYARFPRTYPDTLGRWALHAAHLRNPIVWIQAILNSSHTAHVTTVFWDFLAPSHLFLDPTAAAFCGMFATPLAGLVFAGTCALARMADDATILARMRGAIAYACVISPLAAGMFNSPRADQRAIALVPFVVVIAVCGAMAMWSRGSIPARAFVVVSVAGAVLQSVLFLR